MFPSNVYVFSSILFLSFVLADYMNEYFFFANTPKPEMALISSASTVIDDKDGVASYLSILLVNAIKVLLLILILQLLSKIKFYPNRTRLDDLLDKTKISLKTAQDVLDKWKYYADYPNSDDEADETKSFCLEVPILHIAIFDSCSRKDLVSEAGDSNSLFVT